MTHSADSDLAKVSATALGRNGVRRILERVRAGERIVVTWNRTPMAILGPIAGKPIDPTAALLGQMEEIK